MKKITIIILLIIVVVSPVFFYNQVLTYNGHTPDHLESGDDVFVDKMIISRRSWYDIILEIFH